MLRQTVKSARVCVCVCVRVTTDAAMYVAVSSCLVNLNLSEHSCSNLYQGIADCAYTCMVWRIYASPQYILMPSPVLVHCVSGGGGADNIGCRKSPRLFTAFPWTVLCVAVVFIPCAVLAWIRICTAGGGMDPKGWAPTTNARMARTKKR